jgi:hypothetical protein
MPEHLTDYGMSPEQVIALDERMREMVQEVIDSVPGFDPIMVVMRIETREAERTRVLQERVVGRTSTPGYGARLT